MFRLARRSSELARSGTNGLPRTSIQTGALCANQAWDDVAPEIMTGLGEGVIFPEVLQD